MGCKKSLFLSPGTCKEPHAWRQTPGGEVQGEIHVMFLHVVGQMVLICEPLLDKK